MDSCSTPEQAIERIKREIEINKAAIWEMHGWEYNDVNVLNGIGICQPSSNSVQMKLKTESVFLHLMKGF